MTRSEWRFVASPLRPLRDEPESFRTRLLAALSMAHALGGELELRWISGAGGGCRIASRTALGRDWWRDLALPLYPPTRWASAPYADPRPRRLAIGTARGAVGLPFRSGAALPWSDLVAGPFRALPPGSTLVWRARPAGRSPAPDPPPSRWVPRPLGYALAPVERRAEALRGLDESGAQRGIEPLWSVGLELRGDGPASECEPSAVLEGASSRDGGNGFVLRPPRWWDRRGPPGILLSNGELAELFPSPWSAWAPGPRGRGGAELGLRLGRDPAGFPVRWPVGPNQVRHLLVAGETGMGKSTLVANLALRASARASVLVFDPLGETAREVELRLPPSAHRVRRLSPVRGDVSLNALASLSPSAPESERSLAEMIDALRRVRSARFSAGPFWGPRIEETLHWALEVAAATPGGTLVDAERLLAEPERRAAAGASPRASAALRALRERAQGRPEEIDGARRVLVEATRTSTLRRLLSDPGAGWRFEDALAPSSVTLVSGDAAEVGEPTARTLLSLSLAILWNAIVARRSASPTYVFLEEAPWYANDAMAQMLRLGRRWGVHLVVVAQSTEAFPEELREAIATNVADQVRFRGSPSEARELERGGFALRPDELAQLPRGMAVGLFGKGSELRWIRVDPLVERTRAIDPGGRSASGSPVPGPPGDRVASPHMERRTRAAEALRDWLRAAPPGSPIELELASWRASVGVDDRALRDVGRRLIDAGAVRSARRAGRTFWRFDRDLAGRLLAAGDTRDGDGDPPAG